MTRRRFDRTPRPDWDFVPSVHGRPGRFVAVVDCLGPGGPWEAVSFVRAFPEERDANIWIGEEIRRWKGKTR